MTHPELPEFLRKRLKKDLPGSVAHDLMKARMSSGNFVRFGHRPGKKMGGVMILLFPKHDNWHFPVIRRPEYDGIHGGQISLPGGKAENGDQDLTSTALRETHEEIGVKPDQIEVLGSLTQFFIGASNYEVLPVVGWMDQAPGFLPDPQEVDEVIDIPLKDLVNEDNIREKEISVRGNSLIAPYFDIRSQFIWGATAMMLSEFKSIIKEYE